MEYAEINYAGIKNNPQYEELINNVLEECFQEEKLTNRSLYVNIILTTPENIRNINKEHRGIDKETDVLSFPMFEKEEIEAIKTNSIVKDVLGDIVVSIERVKKQAIEYGHSIERELSYMIVHGFYHLIGYDHINEQEKKIMREKEEIVLNKLNVTRN